MERDHAWRGVEQLKRDKEETQVGTTTVFTTVGEAMDMARAALGYLAAADATQMATETQAC